ncbi:MAG: sigma-70 family RNA polymerase sigma factor [Planctomycetota bacterium]
MRRARSSAPEAWAKIVAIYGPALYSRIRRKGVPEEDAADIVQETFLAASKSLCKLDTDRSHSFRGWIWVIARNKMMDHFKRRCHGVQGAGGTDAQLQMLQLVDDLQQRGSDEDRDEASSDATLAHRITELVRDEFTPKTYQAFLLTTVEGRSGMETAEELGMTIGAVYKAKSRVIARVRQLWDDPFE